MPRKFTPQEIANCEAKMQFETRRKAKDIARKSAKFHRTKLRVYQCEVCGYYHLTNVVKYDASWVTIKLPLVICKDTVRESEAESAVGFRVSGRTGRCWFKKRTIRDLLVFRDAATFRCLKTIVDHLELNKYIVDE